MAKLKNPYKDPVLRVAWYQGSVDTYEALIKEKKAQLKQQKPRKWSH